MKRLLILLGLFAFVYPFPASAQNWTGPARGSWVRTMAARNRATLLSQARVTAGYEPEKHAPLILKQTDFFTGPPTFKYRGFFHDDEDILPRPFDENGYPLQTGTVPRIW